jgi:GAF domain-containing protein
LIVPLKAQETTTGVIEIASFNAFTPDQRKFVEDAAQLIANAVSTQ